MNTEKQPSSEPEPGVSAHAQQGVQRQRQAVRYRRETLVPTLAVAAVAVAAVMTAVMVKRGDLIGSDQALVAPTAQTQAISADAATASSSGKALAPNVQGDVVTAPPLKPAAKVARPATSSLGGSAACSNCGVVETVVAVHEYAKPIPSGYQMHIRMDDGTVRTVEARGALAAGSRVVVEGQSIRALSAASQG